MQGKSLEQLSLLICHDFNTMKNTVHGSQVLHGLKYRVLISERLAKV